VLAENDRIDELRQHTEADPSPLADQEAGANSGRGRAFMATEGRQRQGTFGTRVLFLPAILTVVAYLTKTRKDQTELICPGAE
jgi:hypothetical protein